MGNSREGERCLVCSLFIFSAWCIFMFVFCLFVCSLFIGVFICLCFVFLHVNKLMTSQFSLSKQDMWQDRGKGWDIQEICSSGASIYTSCMMCDLSYGHLIHSVRLAG